MHHSFLSEKHRAFDGMFKIKILLLFYKLCDFNIWHGKIYHVSKCLILNLMAH